MLIDNEKTFKFYGPLRSLCYSDEHPNEIVKWEIALKEIVVSEINYEFEMIQPVDLRSQRGNERQNANKF